MIPSWSLPAFVSCFKVNSEENQVVVRVRNHPHWLFVRLLPVRQKTNKVKSSFVLIPRNFQECGKNPEHPGESNTPSKVLVSLKEAPVLLQGNILLRVMVS